MDGDVQTCFTAAAPELQVAVPGDVTVDRVLAASDDHIAAVGAAGGCRAGNGRRGLVTGGNAGRSDDYRFVGAVQYQSRLLLSGHEGCAGEMHPQVSPWSPYRVVRHAVGGDHVCAVTGDLPRR